jgi:hypothetical protein
LDYNILKDVKKFISWKVHFLQERIVFDPYYLPTDNNEAEILDTKQEYAFAILDYVLQNEIGRKLITKYEDAYNAQGLEL